MGIELEEMDWQNARKQAKEQLRGALIHAKISETVLKRTLKELKTLWSSMSAEERGKRIEGLPIDEQLLLGEL